MPQVIKRFMTSRANYIIMSGTAHILLSALAVDLSTLGDGHSVVSKPG